MNIGMLWFDNDPQTALEAKVQQAASYYNRKYGKSPNVCFVHPSMVTEDQKQAGAVQIRTTGSVLPHHFWIGVNGTSNGSSD